MGRHLFSPDQPPVLEKPPCSACVCCSVLPFVCAGLRQPPALAEAACTGTVPAVPRAAVLNMGLNGGCRHGWVSLTGWRVQLQADRAGRRGMFMVGVMSFPGCLFHSWKQNNVLPIPESCKPSAILCHCLQLPGWGTGFSAALRGALGRKQGGVLLRSVPAMWVPSSIFKHGTGPWACTSSSQRYPLQQLKSCLGKTVSPAVLRPRLGGAECDGARWCKATACSPKLVRAALEGTAPQWWDLGS